MHFKLQNNSHVSVSITIIQDECNYYVLCIKKLDVIKANTANTSLA